MSSPFTKTLREFAARIGEIPPARPAERVVARRLAGHLLELARRLEGENGGVDLVSVICHDLKDPLASLAMGADFLSRTTGLGEGGQRVVQAMARSVERMNHIVTSLHDLARLEAGRVTLDLHERDVAALLRGAAGSLATLAGERRVALCVDLPDGALTVNCDPARIEHVALSLLGHALRLTPGGGRVALSARPEPHAIRVEVSDTGKPIAAERLPSVFDHVPTALRARDGVGLDLAIVRAVVELHGGTIEVLSSAEGEPPLTTFAFTLPRH